MTIPSRMAPEALAVEEFAVKVAVPPTAGTLMAGRLMRPLPSLIWVLVVDPPANVYPWSRLVLTVRPAVGMPLTVTVM